MDLAIRPARTDEIDAIVAVDDDACSLGGEAGLVFGSAAADQFAEEERARWGVAIAAGLLDVAVDERGALVGFSSRHLVDGEPYLDQVSVVRARMREGLGTRLVRDAMGWAARHPSARLWLTTYAHLSFNRPFYERLGFVVRDEARCGVELRSILRRQREVLPRPEQRVAMLWSGRQPTR
jgi:GNAT superfamily N-acetyltransferase